jgi:transposase
MIHVAAGTRVYLACRPVDMRRGFDGLSADVVNKLNADPYSGHLFLFRGKRGNYTTFNIRFALCDDRLSVASLLWDDRSDLA